MIPVTYDQVLELKDECVKNGDNLVLGYESYRDPDSEKETNPEQVGRVREKWDETKRELESVWKGTKYKDVEDLKCCYDVVRILERKLKSPLKDFKDLQEDGEGKIRQFFHSESKFEKGLEKTVKRLEKWAKWKDLAMWTRGKRNEQIRAQEKMDQNIRDVIGMIDGLRVSQATKGQL